MKKLTTISLLIIISLSLKAQVEALTSDGKPVMLFDNKTWEYIDNTKKIPIDAPISIKNIELETQTFIEGYSAKLKKYFKTKNVVRCDLTLTGKDGKVFLKTDWKVQTPEATSYFGYIKKEKTFLTLELFNGQIVKLIHKENVAPIEFTKRGFSSYSAHLELDSEQINLLRSSMVKKAVMNWAKRSEEYTLKDPVYFVNELPKILE